MGFSTKECAWAQTSLTMLGRKIIGIRAFSFEKSIDKEYLHAAGSDPIDIQVGNRQYPLSLTLLKHEVDLLNDAALAAGYEDILEVPHEAVVITCVFQKRKTDVARTITATGVAFTSLKNALDQNAKFTAVELPALAMKTVIK